MDKDDNSQESKWHDPETGQKDGVLFVPYEGVEAFGFKLNIYEFKKEYEVHLIFSDERNLRNRMSKAIINGSQCFLTSM